MLLEKELKKREKGKPMADDKASPTEIYYFARMRCKHEELEQKVKTHQVSKKQ